MRILLDAQTTWTYKILIIGAVVGFVLLFLLTLVIVSVACRRRRVWKYHLLSGERWRFLRFFCGCVSCRKKGSITLESGDSAKRKQSTKEVTDLRKRLKTTDSRISLASRSATPTSEFSLQVTSGRSSAQDLYENEGPRLVPTKRLGTIYSISSSDEGSRENLVKEDKKSRPTSKVEVLGSRSSSEESVKKNGAKNEKGSSSSSGIVLPPLVEDRQQLVRPSMTDETLMLVRHRLDSIPAVRRKLPSLTGVEKRNSRSGSTFGSLKPSTSKHIVLVQSAEDDSNDDCAFDERLESDEKPESEKPSDNEASPSNSGNDENNEGPKLQLKGKRKGRGFHATVETEDVPTSSQLVASGRRANSRLTVSASVMSGPIDGEHLRSPPPTEDDDDDEHSEGDEPKKFALKLKRKKKSPLSGSVTTTESHFVGRTAEIRTSPENEGGEEQPDERPGLKTKRRKKNLVAAGAVQTTENVDIRRTPFSKQETSSRAASAFPEENPSSEGEDEPETDSKRRVGLKLKGRRKAKEPLMGTVQTTVGVELNRTPIQLESESSSPPAANTPDPRSTRPDSAPSTRPDSSRSTLPSRGGVGLRVRRRNRMPLSSIGLQHANAGVLLERTIEERRKSSEPSSPTPSVDVSRPDSRPGSSLSFSLRFVPQSIPDRQETPSQSLPPAKPDDDDDDEPKRLSRFASITRRVTSLFSKQGSLASDAPSRSSSRASTSQRRKPKRLWGMLGQIGEPRSDDEGNDDGPPSPTLPVPSAALFEK